LLNSKLFAISFTSQNPDMSKTTKQPQTQWRAMFVFE